VYDNRCFRCMHINIRVQIQYVRLCPVQQLLHHLPAYQHPLLDPTPTEPQELRRVNTGCTYRSRFSKFNNGFTCNSYLSAS
jgi:hypothetical protein